MILIMARVKDNPSSPFYLHPSENPSLILVINVFIGLNYHTWSRAIKMALLSKNKLNFIDGTISVPARDDRIRVVWERCNTMVNSWIYIAISSSIAQSITWLDNAIDVWHDLKERFSQGDAYRINDLQTEIYIFHQNSLNVTNYYTQLKILWDEFMNLRPIASCVYEPRCNCEALQIMSWYTL